MKKLLAGLLGAGLVLGVSPAFAGQWRLDPRRCPDLVEDHYDRIEDRRDARVDRGWRDRREDRYDRRENRRDESITICPRSAFVYVPDRYERGAYHDYDRRHGRAYGHPRGRAYGYYRHRPAYAPVSWDRRMRMYYRYNDGVRIYVRL